MKSQRDSSSLKTERKITKKAIVNYVTVPQTLRILVGYSYLIRYIGLLASSFFDLERKPLSDVMPSAV